MRTGGLRLVGKAEGSDPKASFERYYRDSYPLVYNYVYRRVLDRGAAEDITSEAFLRAARFFGRFDPSRAKFSTWVVSIARNCIADYYEQEHPSSPLDDVGEGVLAVSEHHEDALADQDLVTRLLSVLDGEERELVFLKYYEGKRNVDIAEELGMNASTVASRLQRALLKMRASSVTTASR